MKRLITVLISFLGYFSLFGQGAPMVVAGKMYIGETTVRSSGPVHIYTDSTTRYTSGASVSIIDMKGTSSTLRADTIIFYSTDVSDGLLVHQNVKGTVDDNPKAVILRKEFQHGKHTYMSLPFNVLAKDVKKSGTSTALIDGNTSGYEYAVYEFDYKTRADSAEMKSNLVWKEIGSASSIDQLQPKYDTLKRGTGYQFQYLGGNSDADYGTVDFYADANDISTLFQDSVAVTYPVYRADVPYNDDVINKSSGWAFVGSRSFSNYIISRPHISDTYQGTVYYRKIGNSQATEVYQSVNWAEIVLSGADSDTISPYTPFFIHDTINIERMGQGATEFREIAFKQTGLGIFPAKYRSSREDSNPIKDQLYFALSSDKDRTFDRFYLNFAESYTESFRAVEDAIKMAQNYPDKPTVWSLQDEFDQSLVVNGLPTCEDRIVKMGFSVPEAGRYTLALEPLRSEEVRNVVLLDNLTGKKVDLLEDSYSFDTDPVANENVRFVLYINSSYTGVPTLRADAVFAYVKDNILTVRNLGEGDRVQVLDLTGHTVASGKASGREFSVPLSRKGVYVVNVGSKSSVLKVLNK
ncbi:MAG: hypothetical protein LBR97_07645 [Dysgonamonadaceae bacterium]|jgi:hypothetical protein|nr:hypothetical protein [Dysgonamonadaceae bacterium]